MTDSTAAAVAYWTAEAAFWSPAEVAAAEAYSAGAGSAARHAADNAKAQLAAAAAVHDAAKAAEAAAPRSLYSVGSIQRRKVRALDETPTTDASGILAAFGITTTNGA